MMYALLFFWIDAFKVSDGARFVLMHFLFHRNLGDMYLYLSEPFLAFLSHDLARLWLQRPKKSVKS